MTPHALSIISVHDLSNASIDAVVVTASFTEDTRVHIHVALDIGTRYEEATASRSNSASQTLQQPYYP